MILFELDENKRILYVRPTSPLQAEDFGELAATIDPFIEKTGNLAGLIVDSDSFPGWESLASLIRHFSFIKEHHTRIEKVALVTDTPLADIAQTIASHFVAAEIRVFRSGDAESAENWISQRD